MTLVPCLVCGEPTEGPRCPECRPPSPSRPSRTRGYDTAHDRLSRRARRLQPFCTDCGATTDLQLHHKPIAWERKAAGKVIRLVDVEVLCGQCNRDRGPARPRGGTPPDADRDPPAKAEFGSENGSQLGARP